MRNNVKDKKKCLSKTELLALPCYAQKLVRVGNHMDIIFDQSNQSSEGCLGEWVTTSDLYTVSEFDNIFRIFCLYWVSFDLFLLKNTHFLLESTHIH